MSTTTNETFASAQQVIDDAGLTTPDVFEYLEGLRRSGEMNMFGAGRYLEARYGFGRYDARDVLKFWMETYDE